MRPSLIATSRPVWITAGEDAYRVLTYADYLISLEWDTDNERLMVFHNAHRRDGRAWAIGDSLLGAILATSGTFEKPPDIRPLLVKALIQLDRECSDIEQHRLMDAIAHTYPYVHNMPPTPHWLKVQRRGKPILEVTQMQGDTVVSRSEI